MSSDSGLSRLQIPIQQPWFAIISRVQRALVGLAVAAFIFLSGGVLDWFVTRQYLPRIFLMLAGAAAALALGSLAFQILTNIQQRYQATIDRLRRTAELNHNIRSSLRVIVHHNVPKRSERAIEQVNEEVVRIESALLEILAACGDADSPVVPIVRRRVS
jgi:predicted DNA-binding ribbon-helix-helix protein